MELGWSAITLAGHVTLCLSILLILWNGVTVLPYVQAPASFAPVASPLFLFGAAILVERIYYIAARLLVNSGTNLWELHPAPDLLSAIVAAAGFWVAATVRMIGRPRGLPCRGAITTQAGVMLSVFGLLSWGLA
ncbi:hypothetical protein SAMN05428995_105236 [Loktanella sp. DSM 29012]|uniref:hypothetical protein n=1 Tax=Loktanella sp. DSM 29012 TaxID=1881056 RepID=UPI0008C4C953|nr:hypothetical protein [Loktanella sp. DSM 29012]SEQ59476.1 hypothetical protein SAMN05428995_105236 [Loktanella sp. DSM 29012]